MVRLLTVCCLISCVSFAQKKKSQKPKIELPAKQIIRDGNDFYNKADFVEAENQYQKALEINPNYEKATYNLGNAKYQQGKFEEAVPQYDLVTKTTEDTFVRAENFHNIGNAMMKQKQYDKAIDAYKNALRNNPNDDETRYNLALAQKLRKNEADNKKDDKNNKDKNDKKEDEEKKKNDENKDNKDEGDNGEKDKDKKGDNKEDPNKDKQGDSEEKKQQPKPQKNKLSKQQIKQLLEAMNNEENKTQKKVNAKKAKGKKIKQEKDW